MKNLYSLILFFVVLSGYATEHNGKHTKQKTAKKSVAVNSDATVDISNKYGNVFVTTWNEDKIDIEVVITVSGDDESWVDKKLASISVDFNGSKSLYAAKTIFEKISSSSRRNSVEINYTVKIPKNGNVKIANQYGNILSHDLNGSTNIVCKYGKIAMGKLNNSINIIKIDYCSKSTIESLKNAVINAKYSGLTIGSFSNLDINSSYTDVVVLNGYSLKYASNYGKIATGKVNNIEGSGNYLSIKIDEIENNLKLTTNYSNFSLNAVSAKASNISITSGYTNIKMNHSPNYTFDFDVITKYANFKSEAPLEYNTRVETNTTKSYTGFYKKSGTNKVTITSNYGNVSLNLTN
ncbi:hypothetical protein [Flavobacterium orientale]|uniref:Adhesin domain-containing protein n=1 Tax=Flavobacterium orientale TaxID=1756020 RepID=A0A917DED7_9FLAO|nr:hypothetical protein [Flavobacterium orientale]GGD33391.1 hypothetical protein GCM10011343_24280 [Flavobacterium orientale]